MSGADGEWDGVAVAWLRRLWAEGLSIAAIGRVMNRSKNSVVGKAHRLHLPERPSPIRRDGVAAPVVRRVTGPTLAPLASVVVPNVVPVARVVVAPAPVVRVVVRASQPCCWPIGEPRTKEFRYCDGPGLPGRSYCAEHDAIAWVARRPRTEAEREADERRSWLYREKVARGEIVPSFARLRPGFFG